MNFKKLSHVLLPVAVLVTSSSMASNIVNNNWNNLSYSHCDSICLSQLSNIQINKEDTNTINSMDIESNPDSNINATSANKQKKHKKKHKNKSEQDTNNNPLTNLKEIVHLLITNDNLDQTFQSEQFKIMNEANKLLVKSSKQEVYTMFNVDPEILNTYINYHTQFRNNLNEVLHGKMGESPTTMGKLQSLCNDVLKNSYNRIYGEYNNPKVEEIKELLNNEKITSHKDLQGNNILKILMHMSIIISDVCDHHQLALYHLLLNGMNDMSYLGQSMLQFHKILQWFDVDVKP